MAKVITASRPPTEGFAQAYAAHSAKMGTERNYFEPVYHSAQGAYMYDPNSTVNGRPPYGRDTYDYYRPNEAVPQGRSQKSLQEIMLACLSAYERVGIIKSVIDMMSEFVAEGVEIVHEDEEPHRFYQAWSRRIGLEDRVERGASWLLKCGNLVVRRKMGQLDTSEVKRMKRAGAGEAGKIPLDYVFYNPANVELVGDTVGALSDKKIYALRFPVSNLYNLRRPRNDLEKSVYDGMPIEVKNLIEHKQIQGYYYIPIPNDKLYIGYYKKDDSDIWAKSFIYSILSDVYYNDKVKLAKVSMLDGMINAVRLWTLGDHTLDLLPTPGAGAKLAGIIANHVGGGSMDIIWDSAINLKEFYPPVENLAGFEENYNAILLGLGIPESLVGGSEIKTSGNSQASFKNFVKRMESIRRILRDWLESEIDIIQKNMGFRKRPQIRFTNADLYDEQTYFNMIRELVDRNIIPDDRVMELIGELPDYEKVRMQKQEQDRQDGTRPKKAGPFHNPEVVNQRIHEIKKLRIQQENTKMKGTGGPNSNNLTKKKAKDTVRPGRPGGSRDTVTRKRRPNKIKAPMGQLLVEASRIYDLVDGLVNEAMLDYYGVKDFRLLTTEQKQVIDDAKAYVFPNIEPFTEVTAEIVNAITLESYGPLDEYREYYNKALGSLAADKITLQQKRMLRISAYVEAWIGV